MRILLSAWADLQFDPAPSLWTLRRFVREGSIYPAPIKVGKAYYVEPTARLMTADAPAVGVVQQMRASGNVA